MSLLETPITHSRGARQPPLYGTLSADDPAFDPIPSSATATVYMRPVDSDTLKINGASAVIIDEAANTLRYDWQAADVDTAGYFVGWWRVTLSGGQYAETPRFLLRFVDQTLSADAYISPEELKQTMKLQGTSFVDAEIEEAVASASRAIDARVGRSFYIGPDDELRVFSTWDESAVAIDDARNIDSVTVDGAAIVAGTDYETESGGIGWPIARLLSVNGYRFPKGRRVIRVTADWGWASVPPQIKTATKIIAARLVLRPRDAAFGVVGIGFEGTAVHIARFDPDLDLLLSDFDESSLAQG